MDNNKLIEIAEEQIKELKKMQEKGRSVEESIKISNEIRDWCDCIRNIKIYS